MYSFRMETQQKKFPCRTGVEWHLSVQGVQYPDKDGLTHYTLLNLCIFFHFESTYGKRKNMIIPCDILEAKS